MKDVFLNQLWEFGQDICEITDRETVERHCVSIEDENTASLGTEVLLESFGNPSMSSIYLLFLPAQSEKEALELAKKAVSAKNTYLIWSCASEVELHSVGLAKEPRAGAIGTYLMFYTDKHLTWLNEPKTAHGVDQLNLIKKAIALLGDYENNEQFIDEFLDLSTHVISPMLKAMFNNISGLVKIGMPGATYQDVVDVLIEGWRRNGYMDELLQEAEHLVIRFGIPCAKEQWLQCRMEAEMNANSELKDYFMDGMK